MDTVTIFIIDHLLVLMLITSIAGYCYKIKYIDPIKPPQFKVHQEVYARDYIRLDGEYRKCKVIDVVTRWSTKGTPIHKYVVIAENGAFTLNVKEDSLKPIEKT